MSNFYPGPSKLHAQFEEHLRDAYTSGLLERNHRSGPFMEMLDSTLSALQAKLMIPKDYEIYLVSSATECWEIVAQSLIKSSSLHLYNGAFGEKWYDYTKRIHPGAQAVPFALHEAPTLATRTDAEFLCLTHCETSNGTYLPEELLRGIRASFEGLIAVDATSSMGGLVLPWALADVWFASVQKCFGLPAGLGILVVSPAALRKAERLGDRRYYNSLLFIRENFLRSQTPYTPNVLGIYLLGRLMQQRVGIQIVQTELLRRATDWYRYLDERQLVPLCGASYLRSPTVVALSLSATQVVEVQQAAAAEGVVLGNGYGPWKATSLRIANFPAHTDLDVLSLQHFLDRHLSEYK